MDTHALGRPLQEDSFHPGEQSLQQQMGSRERLARVGAQRIQPTLDEARQAFFSALPWLLLPDGQADRVLAEVEKRLPHSRIVWWLEPVQARGRLA